MSHRKKVLKANIPTRNGLRLPIQILLYIYRMSFSSIAYVRLVQGVTCVGFIMVKRYLLDLLHLIFDISQSLSNG